MYRLFSHYSCNSAILRFVDFLCICGCGSHFRVILVVASSAVIDEEFERWQNEVKEAEAEAGVTNDEVAADDERPSSPPDGKEEFTDDDGTAYKWDKKIRAWVPQDLVAGTEPAGTEPAGTEPFDVKSMTFQQEDELFPTIGVNGDNSLIGNADALAEKDTDKASDDVKANGKRKLSEKPAEKKVRLNSVCLLV
ncbi:hypothetical protein Tco_0169609 [Tanacetum coccineum]